MAFRNEQRTSMGPIGEDYFDASDEDELDKQAVQKVSPLSSLDVVTPLPDMFHERYSEEDFDFPKIASEASGQLTEPESADEDQAQIERQANPQANDELLMALVRHVPLEGSFSLVRRIVVSRSEGDVVLDVGNVRVEGPQELLDEEHQADNCDIPLCFAWAARSVWNEVREAARSAVRRCCQPTTRHRGFFAYTPPLEGTMELEDLLVASPECRFLV